MENLRDNGINNTRYCDCLTSNFLILARKIKIMGKNTMNNSPLCLKLYINLWKHRRKRNGRSGLKEKKIEEH